MLKCKLVVATRADKDRFFEDTATGRSLRFSWPAGLDLLLTPLNTQGLPAVYNRALRTCVDNPALLVFAHDDIHFLDYYWLDRLRAGLEAFQILGVAGNVRRVQGQPSWCFLDDRFTWDEKKNLSGIVAHGTAFPPGNLSRYGPPRQRVKLLDGLLLAARSDTLLTHKMAFDERFSFHHYDLDFCRQAEAADVACGTWDIAVMHESGGRLGTHLWRDSLRLYIDKWGG